MKAKTYLSLILCLGSLMSIAAWAQPIENEGSSSSEMNLPMGPEAMHPAPGSGHPGGPGPGNPGGPGFGHPGGPGPGNPGGPGWGHPEYGHPGWGHPGGPGWGHPGWGHPEYGHPGWGRPGYGAVPVPVRGGYRPWPHWNAPLFPRRGYLFDWGRLRSVTCSSQDSYGYQYPVSEETYAGFGNQVRIRELEDMTLDRCYQESGGDPSCSLLGCTAGY